jgi:hypothetical protein
MDERITSVKDEGYTSDQQQSDTNALKFNNTRLLNKVQGQSGSWTKF